ncbi:hypothetical protein [Streptomyces murinus]|uniref:hypothetical protein n=1 Tax=Streptomyces murinus TaxID=33900 RepID=UPI003F45CBC8
MIGRHDEHSVLPVTETVAGDQFHILDVGQQRRGLAVALLMHEERSLGQDAMQCLSRCFGWLA